MYRITNSKEVGEMFKISSKWMHQVSLIVLLASLQSLSGFAAEISALYRDVASYIRIYDKASEVETVSDEIFYKSSLSIPFEVSKTFLDPTMPVYQQLLNDLRPLLKQDDFRLESMVVRGGASPEGYYEKNTRLSKGRSQALLDQLSKDLGMDFSSAKVDNMFEDYNYLLKMMSEANDPDTQLVRETIEKCGGDSEKTRTSLRQIRKGKLWLRLYNTYFPALRTARIMLNFVKVEKPKPVEPAKPVIPVTPPVVKEETKDTIVDTIPMAEPREPMLSVKTNLLYDAFWMPRFGYAPIVNIMAEYYFHDSHWTALLEYDFPWWYRDNKHKYFQCLNWTGEARYFLEKDAVRQGWFLDAYGQYNYWDFSFNREDAWQGEGFGAGIGAGWVKRLGKDSRWKIELFAKAGFYTAKYDPYHAGEPYAGKYYYDWDDEVNKFIRRNYRWNWFGPTSIGVNISYDLLFRRAEDGHVTWKKLFKSK